MMESDEGDMGSTAPQSTHRALLGLERSTTPPIELLDEAARILGIDFSIVRHEIFSSPQYLSEKCFPVFAPKEEWALRWLLKKTGPTSFTIPSDSPVLAANTDPRKWLLFYYLIPRVPVKRLARILRDQDGMWQIQEALHQLSNGRTTRDSTSPPFEQQLSPEHQPVSTDYQHPQGKSKKRKRTSALAPSLDPDSLTLQIILSILKSLRKCFEYTQRTNPEDAAASNQLRMSLILAPELAASVLQSMFGVALYVLNGRAHDGLTHDMLDLLRGSLRLWEFRRSLDLGHTIEESNRVFTERLLLVCLSMIKFIRSATLQQQHTELASQLETLVAMHTVQPARKVFFDDLAVSWKSSTEPLLPKHLQPAVHRLQHLLCGIDDREPDPAATRDKIEGVGPLTPLLLEIAVRSSPRSTVMKTQHEQPWLEAFFVCLAHMGGCSLVSHSETENTDGQSEGVLVKSHSERSLIHLETLIGTIIKWEVCLSLSVLVSLTQRFSGLLKHSPRWTLIKILMELDVNIFLPTGISNARDLLLCLMDSLDLCSNDQDSGRQVGTHILLLLMQGFASARDLAGFVNIWMGRLETVEDRRNTDSAEAGAASYSLWEDEDVIAEFSEVARVSANPYFIESHLIATTEALRSGTQTGRHYALVVVLDALVITHEEDIKSAENTVKLLYAELEDAIRAVRTAGKFKAWLWRLFRHVSPLVQPEAPTRLFKPLSGEKERSIFETAMHHQSPAAVFATLEQFHCLISMLESDISVAGKHLDLEAEALTRHLDDLAIGKEDAAQMLWAGRVMSLGSKPAKVTAFLGVLLQHPQTLCLNVDATVKILKALARHAITEDDTNQASRSGFTSLFEGILLDKDFISTPGFAKTCIKATGLMDGDIGFTKMKLLQALPRDAIHKWQRKDIAEWQQVRAADVECKHINNRRSARQKLTGSKAETAMTCSELQDLCRQASAYTESIDRTCEAIKTASSPLPVHFLHLGRMLSRAESSPSVTQAACDLLTLLPTSKSEEEFCLKADCIKIILDKVPNSVNQWTVDNLLARVAVTLSSQGPTIANAAPVIFERLCRLIGALLSRHRIRLGGRYHLLIPVLQSLLRCLFAPDPGSLTTQSQILFRSKLPPWMFSTTTTKLKPASATHLTRLLTSISDPTPSSVRKKSKHPTTTNKNTTTQLNDETKKARRIAGDYMQYFITEYTHCQLNGRIDPEVKQSLMPGLYASIDAMGRRVMRAMNGAMDANQRAIWKGLYDDWIRFGRWDGV